MTRINNRWKTMLMLNPTKWEDAISCIVHQVEGSKESVSIRIHHESSQVNLMVDSVENIEAIEKVLSETKKNLKRILSKEDGQLEIPFQD